MPEPKTSMIRSFAAPAEFRKWLKSNHDRETELWLKIFKKHSGQRTVSWEEAVIEALCWGWIDGVKKPLDEMAYLQRFTPRRKTSNWSKRNREHAERLIEEGRMAPPGLAQVEAARADGRWESAYAPASEMSVPEDFLAALKERPKAEAFFAGLNRANLYAIAYRLHTAKTAETRQRRFDKLLAMLEEGKRLH